MEGGDDLVKSIFARLCSTKHDTRTWSAICRPAWYRGFARRGLHDRSILSLFGECVLHAVISMLSMRIVFACQFSAGRNIAKLRRQMPLQKRSSRLKRDSGVVWFRDCCLVDALRSLGVKLAYTAHGPFRALQDGNEMLRPQELVPVGSSKWVPGKYIAYKACHFVGAEVFRDGAACLYTTCRRGDGQTVDTWQLEALNFEQVYRLQQASEPSSASWDFQQEFSGGSRTWPLADDGAFRGVLQFAASLGEVAALASINRGVAELLQRPSFWRSSLLLLQPCSCAHLCTSNILRCLWPSGAPATRGDVVARLRHSSRRDTASRRSQRVWVAAADHGAAASFLVQQPREFWAMVSPGAGASRRQRHLQPDAGFFVGFTCFEDPAEVLQVVCSRQPLTSGEHWYLHVPVKCGELPNGFIGMARNVRQAVGALTRHPSLVGETRCICVTFCALEMRLYLDSRLFGICQLPDHVAYPCHSRSMRPFFAIETESDLETFGDRAWAAAIHYARPTCRALSKLPLNAMRFFEYDGVTSADLWMDENILVCLGSPHAIQCLQVCSPDLIRRLRAMTLFVGFTEMAFASLVGKTLQGQRGLQRTQMRTWGVSVDIASGRCVHQSLYDSSRRNFYDVILDPAAEICLGSMLDVRVVRTLDSVTCTLNNHAAYREWGCERECGLDKMVRPVLAVVPDCFVDCRAFVHALRGMTISMTLELADGHMLDFSNVLDGRPWINADCCGGAAGAEEAADMFLSGTSDAVQSEAGIRTPSSTGWEDQFMASGPSWYPDSGRCGTDVGRLHCYVVTPTQAAHVFLQFLQSHGMSEPAWYAQRALSSLPAEVRAEVFALPSAVSMTPWPERPVLHMKSVLAQVNQDENVLMAPCADIILHLYAYVWPKASLKEGLARLGVSVSVQYGCMQSVDAFNFHLAQTRAVLASWPAAQSSVWGRYIMCHRGIHSAFNIFESLVVWTCGHYEARLSCALMERICSLPETTLHRVVDLRHDQDRLGGASPSSLSSAFIIKSKWAEMIFSGQKTWEIRGETTKKRGPVGIIVTGTSSISGQVSITDSFPVGSWNGHEWLRCGREEHFLWAEHNMPKHCIEDQAALSYKTAYAWVLECPVRYTVPVLFNRPRGPQQWVRVQGDMLPPGPQIPQTDVAKPLTVLTGGGRVSSDIALPQRAQQWLQQDCQLQRARGDGACGIHATFGDRVEGGVLVCDHARRLAADALRDALNDSQDLAVPVRSSLWTELALPAAKAEVAQDWSLASAESRHFWQVFAQNYPDQAEEAQACARREEQVKSEGRARHGQLEMACRAFFCNVSKPTLHAFCASIGYLEEEGQERCYEMRAGRPVAKGSDQELPAGSPETKIDAICSPEPCFDALRVAVLTGRSLEAVTSSLQRCDKETELCSKLLEAVEIFQSAEAPQHIEPSDFYQFGVEAYLAAVQCGEYFFSVDEIQLICHQRGLNILITREVAPGSFVVEAVVEALVHTDFQAIVLRGADASGPVRSHFDRLCLSPTDSRQFGGSAPSQQETCAQATAAIGAKGAASMSRESTLTANSRIDEGSRSFESAVENLLEAFEKGEDVLPVLAALRAQSPEVASCSFEEIQCTLPQLLRAYETDRLSSEEAVRLQYPLWRCQFYPMAVLFEAWSRTTGLPSVFYHDAFSSLLTSILHKDIGVDLAGFRSRSRYWSCGTAQPGGGKTPALEPMLQMLQAAMAKLPHFAPGSEADAFHVVEPMTHAAAIAKLKDTDGYGVIAAGEGGPILCPAWPSSGTWTQNTHINLQRLLNSAQGGGVTWETVFDRKDRKTAQVAASKTSQCGSTNVTIALFQQLSVFRNWWAQGELRSSIGLAQRFVFSFGAIRQPGQPRWQQFEATVVAPLLQRIFELVLQHLGPKAAMHEDSPQRTWTIDGPLREQFFKYRLAAFDATRTTTFGEVFASGLNKSVYWISCAGLLATLLEQVWLHAAGQQMTCPKWSGRVSDGNLKQAMVFYQERYLFGLAVLDTETRQAQHASMPVDGLVCCLAVVLATQLLQCFPGTSWRRSWCTRLGAPLRDVTHEEPERSCVALQAYEDACHVLELHGLGRQEAALDECEDVIFEKFPLGQLSKAARNFIQEARVPSWYFQLPMRGATISSPAAAEQQVVHDEKVVPVAAVAATDKPKLRQRKDYTNTGTPQPETAAQPDRSLVKQDSADIAHAQRQPETVAEQVEPCLENAEWLELFHGRPAGLVHSYIDLRQEVERVLGRLQDPGVYVMKDRGTTGTGRSLRAECAAASCIGCTRQVVAQVHRTDKETLLTVRARGKHGELAKPSGGALWNVAEEYVLQQSFPDKSDISSRSIRSCFRRAGLAVRCTPRQLAQFVDRAKSQSNAGKRGQQTGVPIHALEAAAREFTRDDSVPWEKLPLDQLVVLPDFHVSEQRVCVIWTSRGMLERAKHGQNHNLKLVVDGKQKLLANQYSVVTVSFLVPNSSMSSTWAGPGRKSHVDAYTGTQEPFLQALVNEETAENMTQVFEKAAELAESHAGLNLRRQVVQVHKDFSKGIDIARRKVFPSARPCDDYAHMRRASHSTLQVHAQPLQDHSGEVSGDKKAAFDLINRLISCTRLLPTLDLFDAAWRIAFPWLRRVGQGAAVEYLMKTYFDEVTEPRAQSRDRQPGKPSFVFAGFWSGIQMTYPGSGSGSQTIESFHSWWQALVKTKTRANPVDIFRVMSNLYKDEWADKFQYGQARKFGSWPSEPAQDLLNSQKLRTEGRSTAVDFWHGRSTKLDGKCNYVKVVRGTSAAESRGGQETTVFYVMRSTKVGDAMPADAVIDPERAQLLVDLLLLSGQQLAKKLRVCGLIKGKSAEETLDLGLWQDLFCKHAVVVDGHLGRQWWPRQWRTAQTAAPSTLCTCYTFLMHAQCEHCIYVQALDKTGSVNLNAIPMRRPKGRKRKAELQARPNQAKRGRVQGKRARGRGQSH
ncbi:RPL15 [Symbiodinium sp. CCMP2592]|nr:RPL15 [Symbiodinium sp. CCMP2592]